jgi:hypothetical protein
MTQTPELLEVIQSDREAAAEYIAGAFGERYRKSVLNEGRWPGLTQAFGRHRIEHATPSRETAEKAEPDSAPSPALVEALTDGILKHVAQTYGHRADILFDTANDENIAALTEAVGKALAGLAATPSPVEGRGEVGWLIERDGPQGLSYATARSWTADHLKALRFAREVDADAFAKSRGDWSADIRIAEHAWN